jgi:hypothetical protein
VANSDPSDAIPETDLSPLLRARYRALFLGLFAEERGILIHLLHSYDEADKSVEPFRSLMLVGLQDAATFSALLGGSIDMVNNVSEAVALRELTRRVLLDNACAALAAGASAEDLHGIIAEAQRSHLDDRAVIEEHRPD